MLKHFLAIVLLILLLPHNSFALDKKIPDSELETQLSFAPVVKKTAPAVVNIYTKKKILVKQASPLFNDPAFRHLFDRGLFGGVIKEKIENSLGSGIIVGSDGVIITNNHVVAGASLITVILNDKSEYKANIILLDPKTDLAILKIDTEGKKLPFLEFMNSDDLEVGDLVLAIGNPFGLGQTVTSGIVSSTARTSVGISDYQFFIQTDASINPGNSGGALVNMEGKIAGINTAIFSKGGGSNGLGFAIPANMVTSVIKNSSGNGRVVRPWLGVNMQQMTQEIAQSLGKEKPSGALITQIHELGAAYKADLQVGDIIFEIDGHQITDEHEASFRIATYEVGSEAKFSIIRDKKILIKKVTMFAAPEIPKKDMKLIQGKNPLSGAIVANLSPALSDELGFNAVKNGIIVVKIDKGLASGIGIQANDIIRTINGMKVNLTEDLENVLSKPQSQWKITLERKDRLLNIIWSNG